MGNELGKLNVGTQEKTPTFGVFFETKGNSSTMVLISGINDQRTFFY